MFVSSLCWYTGNKEYQYYIKNSFKMCVVQEDFLFIIMIMSLSHSCADPSLFGLIWYLPHKFTNITRSLWLSFLTAAQSTSHSKFERNPKLYERFSQSCRLCLSLFINWVLSCSWFSSKCSRFEYVWMFLSQSVSHEWISTQTLCHITWYLWNTNHRNWGFIWFNYFGIKKISSSKLLKFDIDWFNCGIEYSPFTSLFLFISQKDPFDFWIRFTDTWFES